jgi:hypothetical protein
VRTTVDRGPGLPTGVDPDLSWLIPRQRARGNAGEDSVMGRQQVVAPADEPDRWTPLDYVAGCSRAVDAVINWYLQPVWCRPRLWVSVPRAFRGRDGSSG